MTVVTASTVRIPLEAGCDHASCALFAKPLHKQLSRGYEVCAVLELPGRVEEWRAAHRTARKRANRAGNLGYRFEEIRREEFDEDIYRINTSLEVRQGRPMSDGYRRRHEHSPLPAYPCPRHRVRTYGVLLKDRLVAYSWIYRSGELALVSQILGHGAHMPNDVMFLLVQGVVEHEIPEGGFLVYNRADSGTDGLRFFKERCGFDATEVAWAL